MKIKELRAALEAVTARLTELDVSMGENEPTDEQTRSWDEAMAERSKLEDELKVAEKDEAAQRSAKERAAKLAEQRATWRSSHVAPVRQGDNETLLRSHAMGMSETQVRDHLMRSMESRLSGHDSATQRHFERTVRSLVGDAMGTPLEYAARDWQHKLAIRATPEYEQAFRSLLIDPRGFGLTDAQRSAIVIGTATGGGSLVPTHLDPTIILTNDGGTDRVRQLSAARGGVKQMLPGAGATWHGITSAGVTASWDAEDTEVSDDGPSFGAPSVSIHYARAWVTATFQALNNIPGLAGDISMMFADAKNRLETAVHVSGTGSSQPFGIVTALDANTNVEVTSTTAATIGAVDINGLIADVPERFALNASWIMHDDYSDAIEQLGTSVGANFTTNIADGYENRRLKGRPWVTSRAMPNTQTTTVRDNEIVVGDFANYVIVDRPGSAAVEFVQNVFGVTSGTPMAKRGWFMYWETGADSVNDLAFRMLQDKTSA